MLPRSSTGWRVRQSRSSIVAGDEMLSKTPVLPSAERAVYALAVSAPRQMSTMLRIAAVVVAIQYGAHTIMFLTAKPSHGADEVDLVQRMKSSKWKFGGFERSYWDFYFGYGLLAILWGVIEVILLWQCASLATSSPASAAPLLGTLLAANIGHAILTLRYFFLIPAAFDAA